MVMYAVGGRIVDWLGTRRGLMLFASGWSVANMLHALAHSLPQLAFFRALLGADRGGQHPRRGQGGQRVVPDARSGRWRSASSTPARRWAAALAVPIVSTIALYLGWRAAFVVTGALGLRVGGGLGAFYHAPARHPRLGEAERALILGGQRHRGGRRRRCRCAGCCRMRETWGCILARVLTDPISYFLNFWVPQYLQDERGLLAGHHGQGRLDPVRGAGAGQPGGGRDPPGAAGRGAGRSTARASGPCWPSRCAMPVLCLAVTQVSDPALALVVVALVMFGHAAWGNIILPAELFPRPRGGHRLRAGRRPGRGRGRADPAGDRARWCRRCLSSRCSRSARACTWWRCCWCRSSVPDLGRIRSLEGGAISDPVRPART